MKIHDLSLNKVLARAGIKKVKQAFSGSLVRKQGKEDILCLGSSLVRLVFSQPL